MQSPLGHCGFHLHVWRKETLWWLRDARTGLVRAPWYDSQTFSVALDMAVYQKVVPVDMLFQKYLLISDFLCFFRLTSSSHDLEPPQTIYKERCPGMSRIFCQNFAHLSEDSRMSSDTLASFENYRSLGLIWHWVTTRIFHAIQDGYRVGRIQMGLGELGGLCLTRIGDDALCQVDVSTLPLIEMWTFLSQLLP